MLHVGTVLGSRENLMTETVHTVKELLLKPAGARGSPERQPKAQTAGPYRTASDSGVGPDCWDVPGNSCL